MNSARASRATSPPISAAINPPHLYRKRAAYPPDMRPFSAPAREKSGFFTKSSFLFHDLAIFTGYPRLTRADPLSGGPDRHWTSSSSSVGGSPPLSSSSPEPIIVRRKVLRSFSGAEAMVSEADEAAGLTPGNEENEADRCFSPEKPCLPLSIEGTISTYKRYPRFTHSLCDFLSLLTEKPAGDPGGFFFARGRIDC